MKRTRSRLGFTSLTPQHRVQVQVQMLVHAREHSPVNTASNNGPPPKKRKHNPPSHNSAADSPAPSDPASIENVVLPAYLYDLNTRPRLTISRAPTFVPIADDSPYHHTDQLAHNRLGFRYMPAGLAPEGSTNPFRTIESAPRAYRVSWEDRSPFVKVTQDGLGLLGEKGFRSARCNAPVRQGCWYMEVTIEHGGGAGISGGVSDGACEGQGAYVRLGWGRREAALGGPCGLDGYSYGMRDKTGEKITLSRPRPYGRSFGTGDVVGLYISLPPAREGSKRDPHDPAHIKRERIAIEFKGQEYFESLEYTQSKEMIALVDYSRKPADAAPVPPSTKKSAMVKNIHERLGAGGGGGRGGSSASVPTPMRTLPTLPDSKIAFFVNGKSQGVAFRDVYDFRPLRAPADARKAAQAKRRSTREGTREHKENHFDDGSLGYFPLISLFNGARVRLNPGPDFAFPPPPDIDGILREDGNDPPSETTTTTESAAGAAKTWRPLCERYAEFMEEQWVLDRLEEEQARVEAVKRAVDVQAETEKKLERERKRAQANAKKRAKREEAAASASSTPGPAAATAPFHHLTTASTVAPSSVSNASAMHGDVHTASTTPQPEREESASLMEDVPMSMRPLLGPGMALPSYMLSELHAHVETDQTSTGASTPGPQSAYGSEYGDGEAEEQDQEQDQEQEEDAPPDDLGDVYGDPAKLLQYRRAVAVRMEEEEDC
jgi:COMPASS component BRE2